MESRYTYTVVPRIPIRNIVKGKIITRSANLSLSKEEVLECMKHGAVYRKFYLDKQERVTKSNLDRLHRPNRITDKEWERISNQELEETEATTTYVEEEVIPEAITEEEETLVEVVEGEEEEVLAEEIPEESTEEIEGEPEEVEIKKEVEEPLPSGNEIENEVTEEVVEPTLVENDTVVISKDSIPEVAPIEETVPEVKKPASRSRSRKKKKVVESNNTNEISE